MLLLSCAITDTGRNGEMLLLSCAITDTGRNGECCSCRVLSQTLVGMENAALVVCSSSTLLK